MQFQQAQDHWVNQQLLDHLVVLYPLECLVNLDSLVRAPVTSLDPMDLASLELEEISDKYHPAPAM